MATTATDKEKTSRLTVLVTEAAEAAAADATCTSPPPLASLLFALQNAFLQLDDDEFEAECAIEQSRRRLPFVHALRNAFLHLQEQELESVISSERQRRNLENRPPPSKDNKNNSSNSNTSSPQKLMILADCHAKVRTAVKSRARKSATTSDEKGMSTTTDDAVETADRDDANEVVSAAETDEPLERCLHNENNINNNKTKQAKRPTTAAAQPDHNHDSSIRTDADGPTRSINNTKKRCPPLSESSSSEESGVDVDSSFHSNNKNMTGPPAGKKLKKSAAAPFKDSSAPYSAIVGHRRVFNKHKKAVFNNNNNTAPYSAIVSGAATSNDAATFPSRGPLRVPSPRHSSLLNRQPPNVSPDAVPTTTTTALTGTALGVAPSLPAPTPQWMPWNQTLPSQQRSSSMTNDAEKGCQMPKAMAATTILSMRRAQTTGNNGQQTLGVFGWTKEDDMRLTNIMKKYKNPSNWEPIAKELDRNRTARECQERWIRYLKPGFRKGQWTAQEDDIVMKAVMGSKEQPFARWSDLAERIPGRVGKQIRDRWINHLNPDINHLPFSRDDDLLLWTAHETVGKRWVEIAATFFKSTRSENQIKNRWHSAAFKQVIADEFGPQTYPGSSKSSSDRSCSMAGVKTVPRGQTTFTV